MYIENIVNIELADIIHAEELQSMMDCFYQLVNIPTAIIDIKGKVLIGSGWQNVCVNFHRIHPQTSNSCMESDTELTTGIPEGEFKLYKCKNGLWDLATPIIIGGRHLGNLFMGQFFFDHEHLNYEYFKRQAAIYGFDEKSYIEALEKVPRLKSDELDCAKIFFLNLTRSISELSYSNVKLAHAINEQKKVEAQLRKLSMAVEQSPNCIVITDLTGKIEYVNPKFTETTGFSFEEAINCNPSIMKSGQTPPEVYQDLWKTIKSGNQWYGTLLNMKKSGELYWESVNISPVKDPQGVITHFTAVKEDITGQKKREEQLFRLNRTLKALRHSGEAIVRAENEQILLKEICKIIVEDCNHRLVWIGFAEQNEEKSVHPVASAGFDENYIQLLNVSWAEDNERGRGPTGRAIRTGRPCSCMNMLQDPQFTPWRIEAVKRGYASSVALPLKEEERTFGAITIYGKDPDAFSDDEITLLSELANDLAYGITIIRLREAHRLAEVELKKHRDNLENLIRQRTEELEVANELLNEAQKVAHIGHWQLNLSNNNLFWSDEIFRIFGISPNSFGATLDAFFTFIHPDDREAVAKTYSESVSNRTNYSIDHRIIRPDGEIRFVHEQCITHYDPIDGHPLNSLGIVQDITELRKARMELELHKANLEELVILRTKELAHANSQLKFEIEKEKQVELLLEKSLEKEKELNELKSRFISTTSHEFRTPLTSILSSMQLVQRYRKKWSDEKIEEEFFRVKSSIFNLTQLLDDILTISYADSGKIIFNANQIDLHQLCLEIIDEVKHLAGPNHSFNFEFVSDESQFILDPKLIRFMIINLLSNAFKYSPCGGRVKLKVSSSDSDIRISVSDEGIGIPEEDLDHLLKPFFRASNTEEIEGTGLGLSIVQRAIELHKGEIICTSKPDKGTKFAVIIPRGKNE